MMRKMLFGNLSRGTTFFDFDGVERYDFMKVEESLVLTGSIMGTGEKDNPIRPETRRINVANGDGQLVYFPDDVEVWLD